MPQSNSIRSLISIIAFVAGLLAIAFAAGIAARQYETFPIPLLKKARDAWQARQEVLETMPIDEYALPTRYQNSGVVHFNKDQAYDGYTFITAYTGKKCTNYLLDMDGKVLHEWYIPYSQVWEDAPFLLYQTTDDWACWHGAHLFPNGDLIVNFDGMGFPEASGTVKLDKDSNIIWKVPRNTHHDVFVADDGRVFLPGVRYHEEPAPEFHVQVGPAEIASLDWPVPFKEDTIIEVSSDGEIVDEFSVLQALVDSEYRSILSVNFRMQVSAGNLTDALHINNIELVSQEWADKFGPAERGDLLVSMRNLSTIVLIDPKSKIVKWAMNGRFIRQHDPDLLPDGTIILLDNWGAPPETGLSRVIQIDPYTQEILWQYAGSADAPFFTETRGMLQVLPNGNVLIAEANGGRVIEVTMTQNPTIVWEYRNQIFQSRDGERVIGIIVNARRHARQTLTFVD